MLNQVVAAVTDQIEKRSYTQRVRYLAMLAEQEKLGCAREQLNCSNLAHATAGAPVQDRLTIVNCHKPNLAIISAYNDLVSGHCPYRAMAEQLKDAVREVGATAQVAGGVPAVCKGVTQSQAGADVSLLSRDVIAQSVGLALAHNCFDGAMLLGVCDESGPGMLMGAASFAHLPVAIIPSGPMSTWFTNSDRLDLYSSGQVDKHALQRVECRIHHSPGTCIHLGLSNSNQIVFEAMGLMLPGSAFVPASSPLRDALTKYMAQALVPNSEHEPHALCQVMTAKNIVNGIVTFLASGGSMNLTMHLIAIAKAFGYTVTWQDMATLSQVVPVLARIYPNAKPDINAFHDAGGVPVLLKGLTRRFLLHEDVLTITGNFVDQLTTPVLDDGKLKFVDCPESCNTRMLISHESGSFNEQAGLTLLEGNLGQGLVNVSAVPDELKVFEAPVRVFNNQEEAIQAFKDSALYQDVILVVRNVGPYACGMPEQGKILSVLNKLKKAGFKAALVTDGRLAGPAGKFLAVVQVCPEAAKGGKLNLLQDGDMVRIDTNQGALSCLTDLSGRSPASTPEQPLTFGRNLFTRLKAEVSLTSEGATALF